MSPYLLLAGAFVAFLKVGGRLGTVLGSFRSVDTATALRSCCVQLIRQLFAGVSTDRLACAIDRVCKINGGVVIGDRTAHAPVLHFPQLAYFVVFTFGLLAPYQLVCSGLRAIMELW